MRGRCTTEDDGLRRLHAGNALNKVHFHDWSAAATEAPKPAAEAPKAAAPAPAAEAPKTDV
jgi:hypothetical protein